MRRERAPGERRTGSARTCARLLAPVLALTAAVALATAPSQGRGAPGDLSFAKPKDERPAELGPRPPTAALDCASAPTITVRATTDTTLVGDTTGLPNLSSGYSCVAWNESGGEATYRLHVIDDVVMTVTLSGLTVDLDVFLLSSCDAGACLVGANQEFAATLTPGDYVLAVDGVYGVAGPYHAALQCRPAGVPEAVCQGAAKPLDCPATPALTDTSTIYGRPDRIAAYACSPFVESAGERWYAITVAGSATMTAKVTAAYFDAALWLFAGCGPAPTCLGFADAEATGGEETLVWKNDLTTQRTVYLAVDGLRAPQSAPDGEYTLTLQCSIGINVAVEPTSWGAVKSLYR